MKKLSLLLFAVLMFFAGGGEFLSAEQAQGPVEGQNWTSPSTGMEFVWIPQLEIWVGKYEVTNAEYRKKKPGHNSGEFEGHTLNRDRQPVVRVNFDDGKAYAKWLTERDSRALASGYRYRLPSEYEWLRYAQCGDGRQYPWGDNWPPVSGQAGNYHGQEGAGDWVKIPGYNDGFPVTAPVDELWMNPWGLAGVGGNVGEACASGASEASFGAWRGASWRKVSRDNLRVWFRRDSGGAARSIIGGFRLVLSR